MSDFMEAGNSGLVPLDEGWWLHIASGNKIAPNGAIYSPAGEVIGHVTYETDDDSTDE